MADRDPTTSWRNPEVSSASGGHIAPDVRASRRLEEMTAPVPQVKARPEREDVPRPVGRRERRSSRRRLRRQIKRIDTISVLKMSMFFYAAFMVVWLVVWAILYWILAAAGVFDALTKVGHAFILSPLQDLKITLLVVEKWALLAGILISVIGTLFNGALAFIYNLGSDVVGGIEVTFLERD